MDRDTNQLLVRAVTALERLAEEPSYEIPTAPPVCPHCGTINPHINIEAEGGSGKMSEYIIAVVCGHCSSRFFAMPQGWACFESMSELQMATQTERAENGSGTDG